MKKKRLINEEEKEILMNAKIKSDWSLGRLFYIMGLLLPFLVCMIITQYYAYLYIFIVLLLLYLFWVIIYRILFKRYIKINNIYAYESKVLSCRGHDFYYYQVEIEDMKGDFLDYRFPVSKKVTKKQELVVVMVMGEKKYSNYYLLDKETKEVLSSKRSRFDLIDWKEFLWKLKREKLLH